MSEILFLVFLFQPNFKWTLMITLKSMYFNEPMQYRADPVP